MPKDANPQPQIDLGDIAESSEPSAVADPKTVAEGDALEAYQSQMRALDLTERAAVIKQRKNYARGAFGLVCAWLTLVLLLALLQGLGDNHAVMSAIWWKFTFHLETSVMIALIATTTANIIAVLVIVMKFLFRTPEPKS